MTEGAPPEKPAYADGSPFEPKQKSPLLERAIPVSEELPGYGGGHARRDVLAGITVAALALPLGHGLRRVGRARRSGPAS